MATPGAQGEGLLKELLLSGDIPGQVELLLNLLSEAAAGRDISHAVSEVIQVTIAGGVGHVPVKRLAYDLCKAVALLPSDVSLLADGIKNDISSDVAEQQVLALRYLPHLPAEQLLQMLDKGDVSSYVVTQTRSTVPSVRAAATSTLAALLLVPDVQTALAASPDLAALSCDWWDCVIDALGDNSPDVLCAGLAAVNRLFDTVTATGASGGAAAAAGRAALRLSSGVGPLLDTWRLLPAHAQVPVLQLVGHLWESLLAAEGAATGSSSGGGGTGSRRASAAGAPAAALAAAAAASSLPGPAAAALSAAPPALLSYLSGALSSLNPAAKLEAARQLLRVSAAARGAAALSRLHVASGVPPAVAAAAIEALLELKGRLLVEAALEELVSLVAGHLDVLQVPTRLSVLSRLWPMIALLQSPTDRLAAFTHAWRAALALSLDGAAAGPDGAPPPPPGDLLTAILADPFLEDVISERPAAAAAAISSAALSGPQSPTSPPTDGRRSSNSGAAAAAAGSNQAAVATPAGGAPSTADALGLGGAGDGLGGDRPAITLAGSSSPGLSRRRLLASAKGVISSGAALASAATSSLAALPLPRFMEGPPPPRAQLPATLKQELVCTLLAVLQQHPAARAALKLPRGKPVPPPPPPPPPAAAAAADTAAAAGSSAAANGGSGGDGRAGISSGGRAASLDSDAGAALANPFAGLGFAQTPGVAAAAAAPGDDAPQPPLPAAAAPASHKQALADGLAALAAAAGVPDGSPPPATTAAAAGDGTAPSTSPSLLPGAAKVAAQPQAQPQPPPQFGPDDVSTSPVVASLQASVVAWLGTATAVLAATRVCLRWEPLVTPPLPGMPPAPPLPPLTSVNLTTVPVDAWLTLLQAACQAVRGLVALHGYAGLKAIYRAYAGRMLPALSPWDEGGRLAASLESSAASLQRLLSGQLSDWRSLALAVRPRLLWVGAHYLELPSLLDDTWTTLLVAAEELLARGGGKVETDARARRLAASSREGLLLKRATLPQLALGGERSGATTSFDVAAASALVEMPEYTADGLQVGLAVLQYLVWQVQAAAAAAPGGSAGAAEATLARRLMDVVATASSSDAIGADVREWCRRMGRSLSVLLGSDGAAGGGGAAAAAAARAAGPAFAMAPPPAAAARASGGRGALPSGYNAAAGFAALGFGGGSSSDSDGGGVGLPRDARLARRLGLSSGSRNHHSARRGGSSSDDDDAGSDASHSSSSSSDNGSTDSEASGRSAKGSFAADQGPAAAAPHTGTNDKAQRRSRRAARRAHAAAAAAAAAAVGAPGSAGGVWGYPFGGPRATSLAISRRARRHRLLRYHLATALSAPPPGGSAATATAQQQGGASGSTLRPPLGAPFGAALPGAGVAAGEAVDDAEGPVLASSSGLRLDERGFWDAAPGGGYGGWASLSGASDPLALAGRYSPLPGGGGDLLITLRAFNRLPVDLEGVEVVVQLVGPVRAERREAGWLLPRLLPTEAASHSFHVTPTGYGHIQVNASVRLPLDGLPGTDGHPGGGGSLRCVPLVVSMAHLLGPPACPPAHAPDMLAVWGSLPLSMELSAVATTPGVDGLLLLLSALGRGPLHVAWAHVLPTLLGAQAALVGSPLVRQSDTIAIMVTAQLLPDDRLALPAAGVGDNSDDRGAALHKKVPGAAVMTGGSDGGTDSAVAPLPPEPMPLRCVAQLLVRSSSHEVLLALRGEPGAWLDDISAGTLTLGLGGPGQPGSQPAAGRGKALMHPSAAHLAAALLPAPPAAPPPPPVPALQLPPPPRFGRRLRAKADEEDSDAEDEELPPTEEERAAQASAMAAYEAECEDARAAHAEACARRAATVLRRAALAEWRRTACPVLT